LNIPSEVYSKDEIKVLTQVFPLFGYEASQIIIINIYGS